MSVWSIGCWPPLRPCARFGLPKCQQIIKCVGDMPTVAEQLRRAREEQKLDVYQVAEITKIKTDHIRALESGHYDAFSAPVYIRGFVRTYAKVLKLDESQIVADLEAELGQTEKFRELPPLTRKVR